ncbi:NAD(P)H-dependent glycerol-3-phosphate dehydrogenase [Thioalkalivibrio sp.]|uniref:NAD(P)H-dependent glycerol-3-phosphate dehydrogenase n=1 Tax=Thioalkalivibrio sp. TaxID=2093813 RepID=UPI00397606AE
MATSPPIVVLGAGSWGTALALQAARLHPDVLLWARDPAQAALLEDSRENARYLPGVCFPEHLRVVSERDLAVAGRALILVAVPTSGFRETLRWVGARLRTGQQIAWATKGLETNTGAWLHEVLEAELPGQPPAVLSGPSFAAEVAREQPTALTVAAANPELAALVSQAFHGRSMRIYRSADVLGVELGGAFKNVLAIAAGISDGAGFGANARAALMTRGLAELQRLGAAVGAQPQTLTGLSGLGDLVLTCTDDQSRNRRLGLYLGQGFDLETARRRIGQAVEGADTARVAVAKAQQAGVEMPICAEVHAVLYQGRPVREAVRRLLERDPVPEHP